MDVQKISSVLAMETSLQNRLDLLDVITEARPCARLTLRRWSEAGTVAEEILKLGLTVVAGHYYHHHPVSPRNGYVDDFRMDEEVLAEEMICLYIAQHEDIAAEARVLDESNNDELFGISLGYPRCCVDFVRTRGSVPKLEEAFSLYVKNGFYHPFAWPCAWIHDAALTMNYPCSFDCIHSRALVSGRWELLKRFAGPPLLNRIIRVHDATYWLTDDGVISSSLRGHQPSHSKAVAKPGERLYL